MELTTIATELDRPGPHDHPRPPRPPQRLHRARCSGSCARSSTRSTPTRRSGWSWSPARPWLLRRGRPGGRAATPSTSTPGSPATGRRRAAPHRDEGGLLTLRIFECTKPVIAAINGPAVGVGATMTLPMDIRLASESARFGFVFARRGLVPEACSSWFLPRVVGINTALEWTITGRVFDAQEALDRGLVRSVHAADDLLPAAYELAAEIASTTSAVSVAMTRQMLWRMLGEPHPMAAHRVDSPAIASLGRSADVREGVMSFLEKRPPAVHRPGPRRPPAWPSGEPSSDLREGLRPPRPTPVGAAATPSLGAAALLPGDGEGRLGVAAGVHDRRGPGRRRRRARRGRRRGRRSAGPSGRRWRARSARGGRGRRR